jgi:ribosome-binding ATPase YchF (GTP1/OBG family)
MQDVSDPNVSDKNGTFATRYGRDGKGRRLLPLLIKDVAGLIPGAYKGYGKGNRFLNDLCDADVLIHVVDCRSTLTLTTRTLTVIVTLTLAHHPNPTCIVCGFLLC